MTASQRTDGGDADMTELVARDDIPDDDSGLFSYLVGVIEAGRRLAAQQANASLTMTYWLVGRAVSVSILRHQRADYGQQIVATLSPQLASRFGGSYEYSNLRRMIKFYEEFPDERTVAAMSPQVSWSHLREILPIPTPEARAFYVQQVIQERLGVRELRGVIGRKAYERREIADSQIAPGTAVPKDTFKDPYLLDFLGMKGAYSEADLEAAIIRELESFLLEFGKGFAFVARQKRIRFDDDDYYLDLLLYNRNLRRLVAVDLKIGPFKPSDAGQMDFYLKWLDRYERKDGEEAPIGLLLVAKSNREVLELMELHKDGIMVAEYWTEVLPKQDLQEHLNEILRSARERLARRGIIAGIETAEEDDDA